MVETFFLALLEISGRTAVIIFILLLLAPLMNKRYVAKLKYWVWLVLAAQLLIPFNILLPDKIASIPVNIPTIMVSGNIITGMETTVSTSTIANHIVSISFMDVLIMLWLAGVVIFSLYQLVGYLFIKKKLLRWSTLPKESLINNITTELAVNMNLKRKIRILISEKATSPLMLGFFNHIIILPFQGYSEMDLRFILKHELIHCKRNDLLYKLLLISANAIHWFNPFVWLMFHEANIDLEISCDDEVIKGESFEQKKAYSKTILASIQKQILRYQTLTTYFHGRKKTIKLRFQNILNIKKKKRGTIAFIILLLVITVGGRFMICTKGSDSNQFAAKNDVWLQEPSTDPIATVRSALENEIKRDEVLSIEVESIEIDDELTARNIESYSSSDLAQSKNWTNEYLEKHFIAVIALYHVEHDHSKTFLTDGYIKRHFFLTRNEASYEWTIWDSMEFPID